MSAVFDFPVSGPSVPELSTIKAFRNRNFLRPFLFCRLGIGVSDLSPLLVVRYSSYHSSLLISTLEAVQISFTRSLLVVPINGWIFAGWRRIQAMAMAEGEAFFSSLIRFTTEFKIGY